MASDPPRSCALEERLAQLIDDKLEQHIKTVQELLETYLNKLVPYGFTAAASAASTAAAPAAAAEEEAPNWFDEEAFEEGLAIAVDLARQALKDE